MPDEKLPWINGADYPLCTPKQIHDASVDELRKDERLWIAYERGWCDLLKAYLDARLLQAETSVVVGPTLALARRQSSQDAIAAGPEPRAAAVAAGPEPRAAAVAAGPEPRAVAVAAGPEPRAAAVAAVEDTPIPTQYERHRLCCWRCGFRRAVETSDAAAAEERAEDETDDEERAENETDETDDEERAEDEKAKERAEDEKAKERVEDGAVAGPPAEGDGQAVIAIKFVTPDSPEFDPMSATYIVRPENVDDFPDYTD